MKQIITGSAFFGVFISILGYEVGLLIKKKLKHPVFNPLLIAIIFVIGALVILGIDYDSYNEGAKYISYLLTPATVCLAVPLYEQLNLLKKNWKAIIIGILSGVITSLASVFLLALAFGLTHEEYVTLLPKSITTAIGMELSGEMGGIVTISVAVIVVTGIFGNVMAEIVCKLFRINEPVAKGIAIGTSSHAVGTAKAMEMGQEEGAMSSLAIAVAGILTAVLISVFANLYRTVVNNNTEGRGKAYALYEKKRKTGRRPFRKKYYYSGAASDSSCGAEGKGTDAGRNAGRAGICDTGQIKQCSLRAFTYRICKP